MITCAPFPKDGVQSPKIQEMVIRQQYFFVSATLKDILRRFLRKNRGDWENLPQKMSIFLLDVHHSIAILELMHILIDEHHLTFQQALFLAQKCFSFQSQGTVEELSMRWSVDLFSSILPRHMELVALIDHFLFEKLRQHEKVRSDPAKLQRLQLIQTDAKGQQVIRICHLGYAVCKSVFNLQLSQFNASKSVIYREMDDLFPQKLQYVAHGVNPRLWLQCQNQSLASLITEVLGDEEWLVQPESLRQIRPWKSDEQFISRFQRVKTENKVQMVVSVIESLTHNQYVKVPQNAAPGSPSLLQQ
mmetsp:Transcript_10057/g.16946  ORF Transcript_10057/g.16946 Transcript_10057/m.16946 type:complete len:303 (-) Transcript_10057:1359-2267(-)